MLPSHPGRGGAAVLTAYALTIAGSDPTGGAGLEADLKVFEAFGVHGLAVATALTVQDSSRVHATHPLAPELVARRVDVLLADITPDVVKVGMLATAEIAGVVADRTRGLPLVVDPVLVSSSGTALLDERGLEVLRDRIVPSARVVTPNRSEALALLGRGRDDAGEGAEDLAAALAALGAGAVVVTGGDSREPSARDVVHLEGTTLTLSEPRTPGPSPHGTGCAFSSAIAAGLARGESARAAIETAKRYVSAAIRRAGGGRLLVFRSDGHE